MQQLSLSLLLLIASTVFLLTPVAAAEKGADNRISREKAAEIARQRYGGKLLDVRRAEEEFRVKLIKDGRVRVLSIDRKTGEVRN